LIGTPLVTGLKRRGNGGELLGVVGDGCGLKINERNLFDSYEVTNENGGRDASECEWGWEGDC
jgi:hypothetical protein